MTSTSPEQARQRAAEVRDAAFPPIAELNERKFTDPGFAAVVHALESIEEAVLRNGGLSPADRLRAAHTIIALGWGGRVGP